MQLLVIIFSIFISTQAFAQVAKVTAINGTATIERDSQSVNAKIGIAILEKDIIKTAENSRLQMIFKDKTVITLGKSTSFSVQSYLYDETTQSNANFSLTKGFLKSVTGKIGKVAPKRFKIKTKTSTIGIRGTIFTVEANEQFTRLTTISGATYFIDDRSGKDYEVAKNQQLTYNETTQEVEVKDIELSVDEPVDNISSGYSEAENAVDQAEESQQNSVVDENLVNDDNVNFTTTKIITDSGRYARYGYWERDFDQQATEAFAEAVPGQSITDPFVISEAIFNDLQANYQGNVVAFDMPKNQGTGSINMDVFFTGIPLVEGFIDYSINGVRWNNNFNGSVDATTGFQVNSFTPRTGSDVNTPIGTMSGNFYGPFAEEAAGTFNMRGEHSTTGVEVHSNGSFLGVGTGVGSGSPVTGP